MTDSRSSPLVSVVVPTHNRAELLGRAIRSVLNQTYRNLECVVVDDASSDNTQEVIAAFLDDGRVVSVRHETNRRGSAARNTGIAHSKGELIAFLDDDDEWLPTKLEKQVELMSASPPEVGLVYCWMDYYASDGSLMNEHHPVNRGYVFPGLLETNCIGGCPTLLVRRSAIDAVGGFDEHVTVEEDYVFIMRVCKTYEVDLVEEALVRVDYGHGLPQTSIGNYNDRNYSLRRIQSTEAKIRIVGNDSRKYAKQVCHFYNYMAFLHGCLGDWGSSARCFCRALRWRPLSTETPRTLARLAKRSVKRVSGNDGT